MSMLTDFAAIGKKFMNLLVSPKNAVPKTHSLKVETTENPTPIKMENESDYEFRSRKCLFDIENLTPKELRIDYHAEHAAYRNAKYRAHSKYQCPFEIESAASLMREIGPRPDPSMSLDRIENEKGYVPGNIRWADDRTQSINRSNSLKIDINGSPKYIADLAAETGIPKESLRKCISRQRQGPPAPAPVPKPQSPAAVAKKIANSPWPDGEQQEWEALFQKRTIYNESKVDFFLRYCTAYLEALKCKFEIGYVNEVSDEAGALLNHWDSLHTFAWQQKNRYLEAKRAARKWD